jgi:NADPH2:quinone reductase
MIAMNISDHFIYSIHKPLQASTVSLKDCINCGPGSSLNRLIPGLHIIGKVHALGSTDNSSSLRVGDRIAALLPDGGGNAKYVSIPNSNAILLPEDARHEDIICLVSNYMTASQCLKLAKKNGANLNHAKVLVTNASRPVGQAIVELALKEGAKVYATAHKMHEEHLTKLGAKCFNVKPKKWLPRLEGKMDVVIDNLCIDGYESSYRALKPTGVLVCNTNVAVKSGPPSFCNAFEDTSISASISTWWNNVRVKYLWSRVVFYDLNESYQTDPETFGNELHRLIYKLQRGEIKPKVAGRVSLNQVPKAHLLIEKGLPSKFLLFSHFFVSSLLLI